MYYIFLGNAIDALESDWDDVERQVIDPKGNIVIGSQNSEIDSDDDRLLTISEPGTYHILLENDTPVESDYRFQLRDLETVPSLTLDGEVTAQFAPGWEAEIYQFDGTAGQRLYLESITDLRQVREARQDRGDYPFLFSPGEWKLYDSSGEQLNGVDDLDEDFEVVLESDDTYTLVVSSNLSDLDFTFEATVSESNIETIASLKKLWKPTVPPPLLESLAIASIMKP